MHEWDILEDDGHKCKYCGKKEKHEWSDGRCIHCRYDLFGDVRGKAEEIKNRAFSKIDIGKVLDDTLSNIRRGNY